MAQVNEEANILRGKITAAKRLGFFAPVLVAGLSIAFAVAGYTPLVFDESAYATQETAADEFGHIDPNEVALSSGDAAVDDPALTGRTYDGSSDDYAMDVPAGGFADGTYYGSGVGFKSTITVAVTISGGQIVDIQIVSHGDDQPYFDDASAVVGRVLSAQTTSVDTVSGATYSSKGILAAIKDALSQAAAAAGDSQAASSLAGEADDITSSGGLDGEAGADEPNTPPAPIVVEKPEVPVSGYADGVFTASALCRDENRPDRYEPYYLCVSIEVRDGAVSAITDVWGSGEASDQVEALAPYDTINDTYLGWARDGRRGGAGVVSQLIDERRDVTQLDAVSGATWSSVAIAQAYQKALSASAAAYDEQVRALGVEQLDAASVEGSDAL